MRIKSSKRSEELISELTRTFNFHSDSVIARIAYSYSLQLNKRFELSITPLDASGKDFRDEAMLFGTTTKSSSHFPLYKALLDQHYQKALSEDEFKVLFSHHLEFGLEKLNEQTKDRNITAGEHISFLMSLVKRGLDLISNSSPFESGSQNKQLLRQYDELVSLSIGTDEKNQEVQLRINDLSEFDSCNVAIAGMVGSGKTELVKDILYQISTQTRNQLKFIFFDYKGEGSPERLKQFFDNTGSRMIDLRKGPMNFNPLSFINLLDERTKTFNIKSFVDFVCAIATQLGANQKHILQTIITDCFEQNSLINSLDIGRSLTHPTLATIFDSLRDYYETNGIKADTLYSIIQDLATNIFKSEIAEDKSKIYDESLYINLPLELSDTIRQLCVFLTLKYLLAEFSSSNDTEPTEHRIKPLRYVIVIDEAHVYLKNKNASKALEDILRVLRSKGVVVIMLSQGVEDYKTKNFDFSSQIKIPICLNINNKDYKHIESFVGTPRSKQKLLEAIGKLEPGKGIMNISEPQIIKVRQFWKTISDK
jgi:DNA sulfur modification protein DndE